MSATFLLWIGSLLLILTIVVLAAVRRTVPVTTEVSFADLVRDELSWIVDHLRMITRGAFNKGSALLVSGAMPLRRGNELFIERVFGKMKIERGRASSFFLKRIAEHKDIVRREGEFL